MNKLDTLLSGGKRPLFMAHMIAGYPSVDASADVAEALVRGGADVLEMQIPFSDPMADGPTISVACDEALKGGITVADALELLKKISAFGAPIAVMSYINPVFRYGIPAFVSAIAERGASALIVPDCPFDTEEGRELLAACKENGIYLIPVVSPGVPEERLRQLSTDSKGFVYCTSRQGITGATGSFAQELFDFVAQLKTLFKLPVAVGFGVKSRDDVTTLAKHADIVIAGSVFVSVIKSGGPTAVEDAVQTLTS
ncbi:tryptophan synthase subunit alpha [Candidatus Kaiserbacteria bacterium]|nr:tryptophan synthase subunit alpha [Candidatus Kaiserbacteria bacterium]